MAWSNSKVFGVVLLDALNQTNAVKLNADSFKAALYNNSITPDNTVTLANSAYNTGQWATANEVTSSTGGWPSAGIALTSVTNTQSSAVVTFTAASTASSTSTATIANAYGTLVYDTTVTTPTTQPGICYNYFGGAQSVTNGTFTIVWNASGIAQFSAT